MAFRPVTRYLAALLVLVLLCCCGGAHAVATDAQKAITYDFLKGFPAKFSAQLGSSWTGNDYCSWSGITCDADGFVTVDLANKGLSGYLPDPNEDNSETLITSIDVSGNSGIIGNFPSDWAALKALKTLNMAGTSLYGSIPSAWNGMISLESVKITNTQACRSLPDWASMPNLTTVDFSNNNMGGSLAKSWSTLTGLTSVSLSGNNFCGCEPDSWKSVSVLHNAVSSLAVAKSDCGTSNTCNSNRLNCNASNGSMGFASTVIAAAAVVSALVSILAL